MFRKIIGLLIIALIYNSCSPDWYDYQEGTHLVLKVEKTNDKKVDIQNLITIEDVLKKKLHAFGQTKYLIRSNNKGQIILQFTKNTKITERILRSITQPYMLEFKLVDDEYKMDTIKTGAIPSHLEILYSKKDDFSEKTNAAKPYLVRKRALLRGDHIKDSKVTFDASGAAVIDIEFNQEGTTIFEKITSENIGKQLAIIFDEKILSMPTINENISGGRVVITGQFSIKEATELSMCLNEGYYPSKVQILKRDKITKKVWLGNSEQ